MPALAIYTNKHAIRHNATHFEHRVPDSVPINFWKKRNRQSCAKIATAILIHTLILKNFIYRTVTTLMGT
jgi:hypothetical protein